MSAGIMANYSLKRIAAMGWDNICSFAAAAA
jgi:hypothetical protein